MKDLINNEASKAHKGAYVIMFYQQEGADVIQFKHAIKPDGVSEYRINNSASTREAYRKRLEELGFNLKARNFLVFQVCQQN